jgi:ssDNA-binding Zn-finger/Zn-ribbon topoisomerase 1
MTTEKKEQVKRTCEVCGEPAAIYHGDGHWYCYDHYQLRLTKNKFEQVVELHKKGVDKLPDNVVCR